MAEHQLMTNQEMFNIVWNGFKNQDWMKSATYYEGCVYRHPAGMKCAIGHLISDEEYSLDMEEKSVDVLRSMSLLPGRLAHTIYSGFLSELQDVHDGSNENEKENLKERMISFAGRWGLEIPSGEAGDSI
jgi:hypothetical protein